MPAEDRCVWAPVWNSSHSRSYGGSEDQVQACMDPPEPSSVASDSTNCEVVEHRRMT